MISTCDTQFTREEKEESLIEMLTQAIDEFNYPILIALVIYFYS
jgi:hypothetical protein